MQEILVFVLDFSILGGAICLQIFLSKRRSRWPGLILPALNLIFSLVALFPMFQEIDLPQTQKEYDAYGNLVSSVTIEPPGGMFYVIFMGFLIYNISTLVFILIYWVIRNKQRRR